MSDNSNPQGIVSMLKTAELVNAPNRGFSTLALQRLAILQATVQGTTVGFMLSVLAVALAEVAACELLVLEAALQAEPSGRVQAEITAAISEALAATTHAYRALGDVQDQLERERAQ